MSTDISPEHCVAAREFFIGTKAGRAILANLGDIEPSYDPKIHKTLEQTALASSYESGERGRHKKLTDLLESEPTPIESSDYIDTSKD